jgi:hypothetical protein
MLTNHPGPAFPYQASSGRSPTADKLQEVFRLLAIPPLDGYTPAAITAVGVLVSPSGDVAHYPVYAQVISAETDLSEATEVRAAITILRRWLRAQWPSGPPGGTPWPPAFGGN